MHLQDFILKILFVYFYRTDIMMNAKKKNMDIKQEIMAALCGSTVITNYNRKTYRVDDVDFTMNPLSTFKQNGVEVSNINFILILINFKCY